MKKKTTLPALCLFTAALVPAWSATAQTTTTNTPPSSGTPLPEMVITGERPLDRPGWLQEEQPVGEYGQPEWTTRRRFATTRVYVMPPWQWEFEQWWRGTFQRDGDVSHLFQSEISVGLPYRFQLDLYENIGLNTPDNLEHKGVQLEGRWALADWGKIPLNPTLYGEWKFNDRDPDVYEAKLLLGEDLAPRWHWGVNFFYEQEVSGGRETAIGFSQAISYTLTDEKLGLGLEMKMERVSSPNPDGKFETEFLMGPSLQWRPTPRIHLDFVPLVGMTSASPHVDAFIVFGYDFGASKSGKDVQAPTSTRGR